MVGDIDASRRNYSTIIKVECQVWPRSLAQSKISAASKHYSILLKVRAQARIASSMTVNPHSGHPPCREPRILNCSFRVRSVMSLRLRYLEGEECEDMTPFLWPESSSGGHRGPRLQWLTTFVDFLPHEPSTDTELNRNVRCGWRRLCFPPKTVSPRVPAGPAPH